MSYKNAFKDKVAVITGAGSGIGEALARALAAQGARLVLVDIHQDRIEALCEELQLADDRLICISADISDPVAIDRLSTRVGETFGHVDLLFNNAGISAGGRFEQIEADVFERVMDVNFYGVVRMTRGFLPLLRQSVQARIINISSIFGVIAPEGQSAYCASKFAVRGFSMVLRHELERDAITVTTIHPGGVNTRIARDAAVPRDVTRDQLKAAMKSAEQNLIMPPEQAATIILKGVAKGKSRVFVGRDAHMAMWIERILPTRYWSIMRGRFAKLA